MMNERNKDVTRCKFADEVLQFCLTNLIELNVITIIKVLLSLRLPHAVMKRQDFKMNPSEWPSLTEATL